MPSYVDDTQFWVGFSEDNNRINNESVACKWITRAFSAISSFMHDNHLKLNPSKTQFIPFSRKNSPSDLSALHLEDGVCIEHSDEVKNLGVVMYYKLGFYSHANSIRKSCFFQLKRQVVYTKFYSEAAVCHPSSCLYHQSLGFLQLNFLLSSRFTCKSYSNSSALLCYRHNWC